MIGLLTTRLAGPVATGAAVLLLIFATVQSFRLADMKDQRDDYRAELADAETRLATCRASNTSLQESLDEQNAAVAALRTRTEALEEARREAEAEAERAQASARDRLAAARAVPEGETACETARLRAMQFMWGGG